jgi:integrase
MGQRGFVKRRGTTWTAYWKVEKPSGWKQRSKGGFPTKREAQRYLTDALAALQSGTFADPSKLTLGDFLLHRWLPTKRTTLRPSTYDSYRRNIELHIVPAIGHVKLQQLSADQLDRFYADKLQSGRLTGDGRGLAPKTVRYLHTTLHRALADAVRKNLIPRNVAAAADPPKLRQAGSRVMKTWTPEELRRFLLGVTDDPLGPAFWLAATTGMRRGEVLGLRWTDIDFPAGRLSVSQTVLNVAYEVVVSTPKTSRGRRSIALDPPTLSILSRHRQHQLAQAGKDSRPPEASGLVFRRSDGGPIHPDLFTQSFERAAKRLGLPRIRLHDLRHTHATLGLAAGIPAKVMSDRLGHATVAFTQDVYMHAIPRMEEEAAQQIANLVLGQGTDDTDP